MKFFELRASSETRQWCLELGRNSKFSVGDLVPISRGERPVKAPIVFDLKNTKKSDFLEGIYATFISQRTKDLFEKNEISGWFAFPIKIKTKLKIDKFYGLGVTGRCGPNVNPESNSTNLILMKKKVGMENIAMLDVGVCIVVDEKVASLLGTSSVKGYCLRPVEIKS